MSEELSDRVFDAYREQLRQIRIDGLAGESDEDRKLRVLQQGMNAYSNYITESTRAAYYEACRPINYPVSLTLYQPHRITMWERFKAWLLKVQS